MNRFPLLFLALLSLPTSLRAQEPAHAHGGEAHRLGTVTFPNSGNAAAQEPFLRGIALLHSFEYADAAEAFRDAQQADPAFALAYWGEALTHTQLLWGVDDAVGAREALARLAPTTEARLARAGNSRERQYGAAVEAFYADADVAVRARGFADSLHALAAREPDDLEAAAFSSIAIQMALAEGVYPPEERTAMREEAIALADRVFGVNPDHPGAAHYLIHAYDDPVLAPEGLDAARAYASIAPDAVHALHMPSHIFVQIGLWDDTATSNEKAWAASRAWVADRGAEGTDHDFHSLQWLQYAYLQQGRYRMAAALVDSARVALAGTDLSAGQYPDAMHVVGRLEFALAAETRRWEDWRPEEVAAGTAEADPGVASRARFFVRMAQYQRAAGAVIRGDSSAEAAVGAYREGAEPGSGPGHLSLQLDALAAGARADTAAMLAGLADAATAEERVPPIGPPSFLPSHELLGQALLEAGRPGEAVAAFARALERRPNRSPALLGLARARVATGDQAGAAQAYRELIANWEHADPDLAPLAEVRAGAGHTP